MSNAASHQSLPEHRSSNGQTAINALPDGYDVKAMDEWCEQQAHEKAYTLVPLVHGFCIAFRKNVLDQVGHFDEGGFPDGYGEENDICLRASNAGVLLAVALNTFVYHEKSMSYETEKRVTLMKAGSAKLNERHSKERVANCVRSMQANPDFVRLRYLSSQLFAQ
jgi:GT2 family glycosyltransferase